MVIVLGNGLQMFWVMVYRFTHTCNSLYKIAGPKLHLKSLLELKHELITDTPHVVIVFFRLPL